MELKGIRYVVASIFKGVRTSKSKDFSGRNGRITPTEEASFQSSGLGITSSDSPSIEQTRRFIEQNKDLLAVFDKSDDLQERLAAQPIHSRDDLVEILAETAHEQLRGQAARKISKEDLESSPEVAAMVVLNVGGLREKLNSDPALVKVFTEEKSPETLGYQELGKKASALFAKNHPLQDAKLLANHPKVAIYLLERRDVVRDLTAYSDSREKAETFRDKINDPVNQSIFDDYVANRAATLVDSGGYTEDFFAEHVDFAEFVVASQYTADKPKVAEYFRSHPEFVTDNPATNDGFRFEQAVKEVLSFQARNLLPESSPITSMFLKSEVGIASLIVHDRDFRSGLQKGDAQDTLSALLKDRRASRGLSSQTVATVFRQYQTSMRIREPVSIVT